MEVWPWKKNFTRRVSPGTAFALKPGCSIDAIGSSVVEIGRKVGGSTSLENRFVLTFALLHHFQ